MKPEANLTPPPETRATRLAAKPVAKRVAKPAARRAATRIAAAALAGLPLALPGMPGHAQEAFALDPITIFANLAPTELDRTGTSVTIVTEEELEAAGDVQLASFLNRLPGVNVTQTGPTGSAANLRIRGADWRYVTVYIDGIRVTDPSQTETAFNFGHLSTADVGRVEVLRGSQSALYGGSAVGGVINITTRTPTEPGVSQSAEIEGGSYNTLSARYTLGWRGERHETTFTLSRLATDGFSAADENAGNTEPDGYDGTRLSFSTRYRVSDTLTLGAAGFAQRDRQEYDGSDPVTWAPVDADNFQNRREAGARLFAELSLGQTEHMFEITGYTVDREFFDSFPRAFTGRRLGLAWKGTTEVTPALTLVYGADTTFESASSGAIPGGTEETTISGAFAQALWAPSEALDIAATARIDHTSNFGTFPTGRLALAWRPREGLTLRAVVATGFRAPSLDERFGDYGWFVGNPDLTPERSTSFELGAEQRFASGAMVSATLFALDIDNLITYAPCAWDPDAGSCVEGSFNTLENLPGTSPRRGVELAARLPLGERVTLNAAYTYTEATRPNGNRLGLVPRHDLALGLDAELSDRLRGSLSLQHVADRLDTFAFSQMPDFTVVNASFRYALTDQADLTLRIDNVFDAQYQLVDGYGTSDRAFYLGLAARF